MPKAFDTEKFTIGSLLGRYERRRVILPEFQRSYSWEKSQVATFWDDLTAFSQEFESAPSTASYFFGSIVLIEGPDTLLLLDGQQRLATATIALGAIRDVARSIDKGKSSRGADFARDVQRELIEKESDPQVFALTLGDIDEPFFLKAVKHDPPAVPDSKLRSHVLMRGAYDLSKGRVETSISGLATDKALRKLRVLRDSLTKGMTLIGILVLTEEDAYRIFETLNDRGLRLSVPDLVLNLLMRRAPDATARKLVRQHWNAMLRELGRRDVSRFLRHLWVSRYGDLKNEGLYAAIKRELDADQVSSVTFAEQCSDECDDYVALLDANVSLPSKDASANLEGIVKYLQITSAPPLLLAGWRSLSGDDFAKLLRAIVIAHVRYVVATNQNPLDLESRMYSAARKIRELASAGEPSGKLLGAAKAILRELAVSDKAVESAAAEILLERGEATWLMTHLAAAMQSKSKELAMGKTNLEHIFPQNPSSAAWPNAQALESLTWNLGNLTILGVKLNRNAQNKSFADKRAQYYSKSEVTMTTQLAKYAAWGEKEVVARARELAKELTRLWPAL